MKPRRRTPPEPSVARPDQRLRWIARIVVILVPIVLALVWSDRQVARDGELGFPMDDPYIHFQYAHHLATGQGFAFNPGEPSPGATSPLWVVVLGLIHRLAIPLEVLALALGVLFTGLVGLITFEVGIAAGVPVSLAALASLAATAGGRFTWAALSGMEIALATALALALVRTQQSQLAGARRAVALGALAGLAASARPEMALLAPLTLVLEALRRPARNDRGGALRDLVLFVAVFVAILAPYAAFCMVTTGRPFPNTFYAKSYLPFLSDTLQGRRESYLVTTGWLAFNDNALLGLLVIPGLVLWALRRLRAGAGLVLLWPVAYWLYALAFYPVHFSLSRYTIPLIPFLALMSAAVLEPLVARLRGVTARRIALAAAAALIGAGIARSQVAGARIYQDNVANILNMQVRAGRWVARNLPADARVATNDIGAVGFYGRRYCIDTVGLVSSDFIDHMLAWWRQRHTAFTEEALPSYLRRKKPDYCILFPAWYPNLTAAPWLEYVGEFDFPNSTGGGDRFVVYRVTGTPYGPFDAANP